MVKWRDMIGCSLSMISNFHCGIGILVVLVSGIVIIVYWRRQMSGFYHNSGDSDGRIHDLNARLKSIKVVSSDQPTAPNYQDLLSRFNALKSGAEKTTELSELKERFDLLHPENCSNDSTGNDGVPTKPHADAAADSYILKLERSHAAEENEDDDFKAFLDEAFMAKKLPAADFGTADLEMGTVEEILAQTELGVSVFDGGSSSECQSRTAGHNVVPPRDRTDVDVLMEQIDDEVRLLYHTASASSSMPSAHRNVTALQSEYMDESQLLKQLLMSARDEELLEKKYGPRASVGCPQGPTRVVDDSNDASSERSYGSNISDESYDYDST